MGEVALEWKSRIVATGQVDPNELIKQFNPLNFRKHPQKQRDALLAILREVGWIARIIINRTTNRLVDGHIRVILAADEKQPWVPVEYVDLTEAEERLALAAYDALTNMAEIDTDQFASLLGVTNSGERSLQEMLSNMAEQYGVVNLSPSPPEPELLPEAEFHPESVVEPEIIGEHDAAVKSEGEAEDFITCPNCDFEWVKENAKNERAKAGSL